MRASAALRRVAPGDPFRVAVGNRAYLAGSAHRAFPESIPDAGESIPVLQAEGGRGAELASAVRSAVDDTLPEYGGVVLRGLGLAAKEDFEALMRGLGYERFGYTGGIAVRRGGSGFVLDASDEDARITLSPHNEMSYLPDHPRRVFFFCATAASAGGEVPVNDVRETARIIPGEVLAEFRSRGVMYHRNLPRESGRGQRGWMDTFGTGDRDAVARRLESSGYRCRWVGDRLQYSYVHGAFTVHEETAEELWFNQVTELHCSYWRSHPDFAGDLPDHAYPATTAYGDGGGIDEDLVSFLRGALWRTARAVRMRRGDVLALDNRVVQHGRFAFEGEREHFVALTR
ncbi:TauD/TfdA family dioxygenase [Nocardiopsis chromatogenes]|uniref:TauD/TfdA family dioxygenase n=1 Tax=Nocardiopsis chromatogenes TaxID=280239 RepID=UPI00036630D4|nr:TauD/TfdA family dioxygenase [Nocardiopsis chromatogenes]